MTQEEPVRLAEGEFFGSVPKKRSGTSSVMAEVIHKHRTTLPAHSHELAYFNFLLDGRYTESYGRKSFACVPMTVIWCPPEVVHKDEYGSDGVRIFSIEIRKGALDLLRTYVTIPKPFSTRSPRLVALCLRLLEEFKSWTECSPIVAEGLTLEMLGAAAGTEERVELTRPSWLDLVEAKLNDEFATNPSVTDLARDAGVHPVHLSAVFRRFFGKSISEHSQDLRVSHSLGLLRRRELPLAEIAAVCGFADQSHFTRIFKSRMGITPGKYRRSLA